MADKERPEERNINTNGGNYIENIKRDYIQIVNHAPNSDITLRGENLTSREYKNRQRLLDEVKNFWVKGVLEKSLHNQVLIELGLEEHPDAIINSWNAVLETGENSPQSLPSGTKIIDIFDDIGAGRTLLILGEPGSGKTTTLLELTRDLIARAQQDTQEPIPLIFHLSSWATKRQKFEDWLIEELGHKYNVHKDIRESLVTKQQLFLLLDGLDEVKGEYRDDCIVAINQFKQDYDAELVVCSRTKDYRVLSQRFKFTISICLKLLSQKQIYNYLDGLGANLEGLRKLIAKDEVWQELAKAPLMLNLMVVAYRGVAMEDLPKIGMVEARRKQLFDDYIEQVFKRRKANRLYTNKQVIHWLVWLAQTMIQQSQTIFLIEKMQPSWLENQKQIQAYRIIGGIIVGVSIGLKLGLIFNPIVGAIGGVSVAIIFKLTKKIVTVNKLRFYWRKLTFAKLSYGLIVGMIVSLIVIVIFDKIEGLIVGLIAGLIVIFGVELHEGLTSRLNSPEIEIKTSPNQGILTSAHNTITIWLIFSLIFSLILGLMGGLSMGFSMGLSVGLIAGLTGGLIGGLIGVLGYGGKACIQHFTLRLILHRHNYIPWNYARFLDYAADRILLQKVGGGYIFIHRMLMEHFAEMPLE